MKKEEEIQAWIKKAEESIVAAELIFNQEMFSISASRSYYAMFYIAQALLHSLGLSFKSHGTVIAEYGKNFAKTGLLDPKFHKGLIHAYEERQVGDYVVLKEVSESSAKELLSLTKEFLEAAKKYRKKK